MAMRRSDERFLNFSSAQNLDTSNPYSVLVSTPPSSPCRIISCCSCGRRSALNWLGVELEPLASSLGFASRMTAKISGPVLASEASRNICPSSDVCKPLAFSFLPCSNSSFHVNKKNLNSQPCTNPNTTFRYLRFYLVLSCVLSFAVNF